MKSFEQLAQVGFEAYEKSGRGSSAYKPLTDEWQRLHPELKAHWLAVAKAIVAEYAVIH